MVAPFLAFPGREIIRIKWGTAVHFSLLEPSDSPLMSLVTEIPPGNEKVNRSRRDHA